MFDRDPAVLDRALSELALISADLARPELVAFLSTARDLPEALDGAAYVQECIGENLASKRELFEAMDALASPAALLASSTSTFPPSAFMVGLPGRNRCIVAHPFNPAYAVPLAEVLASPDAPPDLTERACDFLRSVGQDPVVVRKEVHGFVANRLQAAVVCEAIHLVASGVVSAEELDRCMTSGLGLRWAFMGPLQTMDLNATEGFARYAEKYSDVYRAMALDLKVDQPWPATALRRIEAAMRRKTPATSLQARRRWRDRMVVKLRQCLTHTDEM